jgi:ParB family chromosome partitioning protein
MTKRRGLGRGLDALIPDNSAFKSATDAGLQLAAVDAIEPNPHQPRSIIDEPQLEELAASIREHGLIQPLIVTRNARGDGFTLIAGERRWRAAQRAGLTELPVVVKEATAQAMLELAIIENVQRADLNPLEEALAYRQLIDDFGLTQQQVADRMGKSRPAVANVVRLLTLPNSVQGAVAAGEISEGHARCLVSLPTPEAQNTVLKTILRQGLNVRQTEGLVRKLLSGESPRRTARARLNPDLRDLREQFRQSLGTRVDIKPGPNGEGGRVVIHYYSDEDLQTIFESIVDEKRAAADDTAQGEG